MIPTVKQLSAHRSRLDYRLCSSFVLMAFVLNCVIPPQFAQAQNIGGLLLPNPGSMMAPSPAFVPLLIKGMKIHPENPLQFDFIVDSGHTQFDADQMKAESNKLIKYFFAALTMPKDDLWVNLSPYEEGRIISSELSKTELGRDMLAQDYILKQLTASFLSPDSEVGAKFWKKVYAKAQEQFGTTDIPINTLNKVWIMPESATIFENGQAVYIVKSHLKVMLEEDYNARSLTNKSSSYLVSRISEKNRDTNNEIRDTFDKESSQIMREIILPEIEREVNEGQHFAPLRQIYHSLLLAKWYKQMIKDTLLSKAYVDQKKVGGIEVEDKEVTNKIYNLYVDAYKKGAYTFIREDYDELSKEMIPRKYLTGGFKDADPAMTRTNAQEFASVGERFNVAAGAAGVGRNGERFGVPVTDVAMVKLPGPAKKKLPFQHVIADRTKIVLIEVPPAKITATEKNYVGNYWTLAQFGLGRNWRDPSNPLRKLLPSSNPKQFSAQEQALREGRVIFYLTIDGQNAYITGREKNLAAALKKLFVRPPKTSPDPVLTNGHKVKQWINLGPQYEQAVTELMTDPAMTRLWDKEIKFGERFIESVLQQLRLMDPGREFKVENPFPGIIQIVREEGPGRVYQVVYFQALYPKTVRINCELEYLDIVRGALPQAAIYKENQPGRPGTQTMKIQLPDPAMVVNGYEYPLTKVLGVYRGILSRLESQTKPEIHKDQITQRNLLVLGYGADHRYHNGRWTRLYQRVGLEPPSWNPDSTILFDVVEEIAHQFVVLAPGVTLLKTSDIWPIKAQLSIGNEYSALRGFPFDRGTRYPIRQPIGIRYTGIFTPTNNEENLTGLKANLEQWLAQKIKELETETDTAMIRNDTGITRLTSADIQLVEGDVRGDRFLGRSISVLAPPTIVVNGVNHVLEGFPTQNSIDLGDSTLHVFGETEFNGFGENGDRIRFFSAIPFVTMGQITDVQAQKDRQQVWNLERPDQYHFVQLRKVTGSNLLGILQQIKNGQLSDQRISELSTALGDLIEEAIRLGIFIDWGPLGHIVIGKASDDQKERAYFLDLKQFLMAVENAERVDDRATRERYVHAINSILTPTAEVPSGLGFQVEVAKKLFQPVLERLKDDAMIGEVLLGAAGLVGLALLERRFGGDPIIRLEKRLAALQRKLEKTPRDIFQIFGGDTGEVGYQPNVDYLDLQMAIINTEEAINAELKKLGLKRTKTILQLITRFEKDQGGTAPLKIYLERLRGTLEKIEQTLKQKFLSGEAIAEQAGDLGKYFDADRQTLLDKVSGSQQPAVQKIFSRLQNLQMTLNSLSTKLLDTAMTNVEEKFTDEKWAKHTPQQRRIHQWLQASAVGLGKDIRPHDFVLTDELAQFFGLATKEELGQILAADFKMTKKVLDAKLIYQGFTMNYPKALSLDELLVSAGEVFDLHKGKVLSIGDPWVGNFLENVFENQISPKTGPRGQAIKLKASLRAARSLGEYRSSPAVLSPDNMMLKWREVLGGRLDGEQSAPADKYFEIARDSFLKLIKTRYKTSARLVTALVTNVPHLQVKEKKVDGVNRQNGRQRGPTGKSEGDDEAMIRGNDVEAGITDSVRSALVSLVPLARVPNLSQLDRGSLSGLRLTEDLGLTATGIDALLREIKTLQRNKGRIGSFPAGFAPQKVGDIFKGWRDAAMITKAKTAIGSRILELSRATRGSLSVDSGQLTADLDIPQGEVEGVLTSLGGKREGTSSNFNFSRRAIAGIEIDDAMISFRQKFLTLTALAVTVCGGGACVSSPSGTPEQKIAKEELNPMQKLIRRMESMLKTDSSLTEEERDFYKSTLEGLTEMNGFLTTPNLTDADRRKIEGNAENMIAEIEKTIRVRDDYRELLRAVERIEGMTKMFEELMKETVPDAEKLIPQPLPGKPKKDDAMIDQKNPLGGIDMNEMEYDKQGTGINVQFNEEALKSILNSGIQTLTPFIIHIKPLPNILPALGLESTPQEEYKVSQAK